MYIVKFVRHNENDEIYYYNNMADAEYHFNLFKEDDSNLYKRVELLKDDKLLKVIIFSGE